MSASWYFVDPEGVTQGPMNIESLKPLYGTTITDTTYLWNGVTVHNWTELQKVPVLFRELSSNSNSNHEMDALSPIDIDNILNEIEDTEKKMEQNKVQIQSKSTHKTIYRKDLSRGISINWNEIYLQRQSILELIESHQININMQNPTDGMTLLMHSIIIGDFALIKQICILGADICIRDHDGDDALDYSLVFQRYKVTQLLLLLCYDLRHKETPISEAISIKNKEAKYMMQQQFGRLKDKIVHFVTRAIRERKSFDINMLYFAWYFTANCKSKVGNTMPDPLQSKLFKTMMKTYWEIISNKSQDKKGWKWLRKHFINSMIWYLPHPDSMIMIDSMDCNEESDDDETDIDCSDSDNAIGDDEKCNIERIVAQIESNSDSSEDKLLFFLFL